MPPLLRSRGEGLRGRRVGALGALLAAHLTAGPASAAKSEQVSPPPQKKNFFGLEIIFFLPFRRCI